MPIDIAIATTRPLPEPDPDEPVLLAALKARGVSAAMVPWRGPIDAFSEASITVLRSTWDYAWHGAEFVAWLEAVDAVTRLHNAAKIACWNLHKRYLLELAGRGVPVVPTRLVERGDERTLASVAADLGADRIVVKPAIGAGSFETWAMDRDALDMATWTRLVGERDLLVQPYVESIHTHGERSIVFLDGRVSHGMRKEPRFAGGVEQVTGPWPIDADDLAVAEAALSGIDGDLLYGRVDLVRDAMGAPMVSEVELLEPSLFLAQHPPAVDALADAIVERLGRACASS